MSVLSGASALVTGGAGTVGSTLVDQLLAAGVASVDVLDNLVLGRMSNLAHALSSGRVRFIEGDITDLDAVHDAAAGKDFVFHEAAVRLSEIARDPRRGVEVLVNGTLNVLQASVRHKVDKILLASSASVYGAAESFPTHERHHPYNSDTLYGTAKCFTEGMARSFKAMHGLDYVALRYFNIYGPRMDVHGLYTEVLVRWMERIADGRPPLIFGDGSQTMDFVYTEDVARANVLAAESNVRAGVYNVGSGVETSMLGLAVALLAAMDSNLTVEFGPERGPAKVPRQLADATAARRDFGFQSEVPLEEGLRRLAQWWRPLREEIAAARVVASA